MPFRTVYRRTRQVTAAGRSRSYHLTSNYGFTSSMDHTTGPAKRSLDSNAKHNNVRGAKKRKREKNIRAGGSSEQVLAADIRSLLRNLDINKRETTSRPPPLFSEVEVRIETLSSTGDGLGRLLSEPSQVCSVPFTAPGDVVLAKVIAHIPESPPYSKADLVKVIEASLERDETLVRCRHFKECSGCQFQMLPYWYQLAHKKNIIEKAYQNFSGLASRSIPAVGETIGSPLQYGYRTKLTPHFDGPKSARKLARKGERAYFDEVPPIGFHKKQTRRTMDIEECPISTDVIQMGLRRERERVRRDIESYSKGATLLLRESTERLSEAQVPPGVTVPGVDEKTQTRYEYFGDHIHAKSCVTDPKATFTEHVGDFRIKNVANSFFQNNNSILSTFVTYIQSHVLPASPSSNAARITNLIDAYSGSGLFSITLASLFERTIGIDIDNSAIAQARANVDANASNMSGSAAADVESRSSIHEVQASHMPHLGADDPENIDKQGHLDGKEATSNQFTKIGDAQDFNKPERSVGSKPQFIAADASQLFASVKALNPAETVVILDPPRKGCDESFLAQLLDFAPERIVYVSCNVHTQAADVGRLLAGGMEEAEEPEDGHLDRTGPSLDPHGLGVKNKAVRYTFESLQGFDFFPQTSHVESVAVLSRARSAATETSAFMLGTRTGNTSSIH